ncbi:MAG: PH domain-containing protein [Micrococcales bacterium]|nr:PH domain-containing protein [Micrococcales bacterium]
MRFKTKIDWWFHPVALVCLGMPIAFAVAPEGFWGPRTHSDVAADILVWVVLGVLLVLGLLLAFSVYVDGYYELEDEQLRIRFGPLMNKRIPYRDITGMTQARNPLAGPAASLDRVAIEYSVGIVREIVLISPRGKQEFMRELSRRTAR